MDTVDTLRNTGPLIQDSLLGSKYFNPGYLFDNLVEVFNFVFTKKTLDVIYTIFSLFALFFMAVIIYATIRMFEIRKKERLHLQHEIAEYARNRVLREKKVREEGVFRNPRWKKVLDYLFSTNQNDWRLAIIEADSMLFDLLTELGFQGETLGDKLKNAGQDHFRSLPSAWEAHTVRNKVVHEGVSFEISLHEARRVVALYEQIFQEFGYI